MGCAASTNKKKKNGKKGKADGKKPKEKKKSYGREGTPDAMRKEIADIYKGYKEEKNKLDPFLAEKIGVTAILNDEREKLLGLLAKQSKLSALRGPLMEYTWEKDAEDIHRAFSKFSADKALLIGILATRTKWQIVCIAEVFEAKYGTPLLAQVINDMTTLLGKLITGKETGLGKLLTYRILPQHERDAAFLRDFSDGYGLDDENLIEIVCTRSNAELKAAIDCYLTEYGKYLPDLVRSKSSYQNYREFMLKVLECRRDEENKPFDVETAKKYADELYAAGGARKLGMVPEPFIRILATVNRAQFESINEQYKEQHLVKDITSKLGGDFELAVLTMCADKYDFFAGKLEKYLKGYSADKDGICRILGCLSRWECRKLREAYDRGGYKRTLEVALKSTLKGHYQLACLTMIAADMSQTPMGSDREAGEDEKEAEREGIRARKIAEVNYRTEKAIERGREVMSKRKKVYRERTEDEGEGSDIEVEADFIEDDEVLKFHWDGKGRFLDVVKLTALLEEAKAAQQSMADYRERIADEIAATKDVYFAITKHCSETETWLRLLGLHVRCLNEFISRRDKAAGGNGRPLPASGASSRSLYGGGNPSHNSSSNSLNIKSTSTSAAKTTKGY